VARECGVGAVDDRVHFVAGWRGHFFRADMLDSQFADLEEPSPDEGALVVSDRQDAEGDRRGDPHPTGEVAVPGAVGRYRRGS
jgi:hypothetical protein